MSNPKINIQTKETLSDYWYTLNKYTFDYQTRSDEWETHTREVYDRGNGACVLLYNTTKKTVVLTKQFRLPTYLNKNTSGMMVEACAGVLDDQTPEDCIRNEILEETGYKVEHVTQIMEAYMSPGAVTEILYFFMAEYTDDMKVSKGGGLQSEEENIEVLELPFDEAFKMISSGAIKDAKTIMLLQHAKIHNLI